MLNEKEISGCKEWGTGAGNEDGEIWGRKAQLHTSVETSYCIN